MIYDCWCWPWSFSWSSVYQVSSSFPKVLFGRKLLWCSSHCRKRGKLCSTSWGYSKSINFLNYSWEISKPTFNTLSSLLDLNSFQVLILQYHLPPSEYKTKEAWLGKTGLLSKGRYIISLSNGAEYRADSHFQMTSVTVIIFFPASVHLIQFKVLREGHTTVCHLSINLFLKSRCQRQQITVFSFENWCFQGCFNIMHFWHKPQDKEHLQYLVLCLY